MKDKIICRHIHVTKCACRTCSHSCNYKEIFVGNTKLQTFVADLPVAPKIGLFLKIWNFGWKCSKNGSKIQTQDEILTKTNCFYASLCSKVTVDFLNGYKIVHILLFCCRIHKLVKIKYYFLIIYYFYITKYCLLFL